MGVRVCFVMVVSRKCERGYYFKCRLFINKKVFVCGLDVGVAVWLRVKGERC